ncbi:sperm-associated antigen 1 [Condylostylus longicornis]|uniref:sperm-associated antigen 1 n=1 Tax=Condylostylus longicornis TaxID=2530218 RepID=UPI00244E4F9B|nr:sperm-associated antigen 1 [Condylostylus longicornis]
MNKPKRKLMQRYEIPVNHLEFNYIKKCNNAREMEKILRILYSGEEGYYKELTQCAEERLKILNPNSKLFRYETAILRKQFLDQEDWEKDGEPVVEWSDEVKVKDNFLSVIANEKSPQLNIPDIRGKNEMIIDNEKRIKSTDYRAWDKYDADTECLKMELDEERIQEENERNKLKEKKEKIHEIIKPISENDEEILEKLTNVEKEALAIKHKDCGNDYFRIKEYQNAIIEYTKCIEIYPTAVAYNNRAISYMKMFLYRKALDDIEKCLEMDPKNIKALLRKAQTFIAMERNKDAHEIYTKIISIEPSNIAARNGLNEIKNLIPYSPPPQATRISIEEDEERKKIDDSQVELNNKIDKNSTVNNQNDDASVIESKKNISEFITAITSNENKSNKNLTVHEPMGMEKLEKNSNEKSEENLDVPIKKTQIFENVEILKSKYQIQNFSNITQHEDVVNEQNLNLHKSKNIKNCLKENEKPKQNAEGISPTSECKEKTASNQNNSKETVKIPKTPPSCGKNKKLHKKPKPVKQCDDENYVQEDLSKLIIPKKIIKNKFAKTMEAFKNNNISLPMIPNMNGSRNNTEGNQKSLGRSSQNFTSEPKINIKLLPDKSKNEVFIREIK